MTRALIAIVLLAGCCAALPGAWADDVRPATLLLEDEGAGHYAVRWQTPLRGRATLRLEPLLPEGATPIEGSYERALLGDSLVETWRVALREPLEGQGIGVRGSALAARQVVLTVRTRSGRVHRAVLSGSRSTYVVPEPVFEDVPSTGSFVAARAWEGFRAGLSLPHVLLVLLLVLALGGRALAAPLQGFLLAACLGRVLPFELPPSLAAALIALAALLVAREVVRGTARRLAPVAALAGLGFGAVASTDILSILGTDGAHLLVALGALLLVRFVGTRRRALAWVAGPLATALALGLALQQPARAAEGPVAAPISPMALVGPQGDVTPAGRASAVKGMDAFLDIGVFETRVEVLARLPVLERWLGLEASEAQISEMQQASLLPQVQVQAARRLRMTMDGAVVTPRQVRAAFTVRDAAGVYLREEAAPETRADATLGLVFFFATDNIPTSVEAVFQGLPPGAAMSGRVLDPELSRPLSFGVDAPALTWRNELRTDPLPTIESVAVQRTPVRVPLLSLGLLVLGLLLAWRLRRREGAGVVLRAAVAAALLCGGLLAPRVPWLEGAHRAPSPAEERAIVGSLLDNLYRAFNERGEAEVYDRLSLSLVGDQLADAYVENRRILAERRFGGARTHVEVVEVDSLTPSTPGEADSFRTSAVWTVTGTVTHFGHRHLRRNRYEADLAVGPRDGTWKVLTLDVRSTSRER